MSDTAKSKSSPRRIRLRTLFKLACMGIFIAVLIPALQILVPAIEYRDDLLAMLNYSDDCKAPCFMGITPGKTTLDEAVAVLNKNLDVEFRVQHYDTIPEENAGHINFETVRYGSLTGRMDYKDGVIYQISLNTSISYTTFILTYGYPQWQTGGGSMFYPDKRLRVIPKACHDIYNFLRAGTWLMFVAHDSNYYAAVRPYSFSFPGCGGVRTYDMF